MKKDFNMVDLEFTCLEILFIIDSEFIAPISESSNKRFNVRRVLLHVKKFSASREIIYVVKLYLEFIGVLYTLLYIRWSGPE